MEPGLTSGTDRRVASRRAGRQLAEAFNRGMSPQPINVTMRLQNGEFCVGQTPVTVYQWQTGDGSWQKRGGGWFLGGGPLSAMYSAAVITTNIAGNAARRSRAAKDAQAQWRQVEQGTLFLTNQRWAIQGSSEWNDLWFSDVRLSDCDGQMIVLELNQIPKTGFVVDGADYWYVMFNKLAFGNVAMPPPPADGQDLPPLGTSDRGIDGPGWIHREPHR